MWVWSAREREFDNTEELKAFAVRKVSELDKYDKALEKREEDKLLVDSGNMTREEFIENTTTEPGCLRPSSSFVVNDQAKNDRGLFCKVLAWLRELTGTARMR